MTVIFTLSSISSALLFWSVNHISMNKNYSLVVFNINWPNYLFGKNKMQCAKTTSSASNLGTISPSLF